jgi:hypothetical protein
MNWDAPADCLRDLSWIREDDIVIIHSDVAFKVQPAERETYLDIMAETVRLWRKYPPRQFRVAFPRRESELAEYRPSRGGALS